MQIFMRNSFSERWMDKLDEKQVFTKATEN